MAHIMTGKIEWMASFIPTDAEPIAEIYDEGGKIMKQKPIPCRPPVNCPFIMDDVEFGTYRAGLAYDGNRYYYVQGQSEITAPNDLESASLINVSETITPYLEITVDAS